MKQGRIVRRSLAEAPARTDWSTSDALTDADIEAAVRDDPDAAPTLDAAWFETARMATSLQKEAISIRLDKDVLDFFRTLGPRYQTRINAVLRSFMEHHAATERRAASGRKK